MIHAQSNESQESAACDSHGSRSFNREQSFAGLLKDLTSDSRTLIQKEIELAKAELSETASGLARNIGYLAIGGLIGFAGFLTLLGAASYGLMEALDERIPASVAIWLAPLIVGGVVAMVGAMLITGALATLRQQSLAPRKTLNSLQENKQWLVNRTRA